jgi:hypothetical protein
VRWGRLPRDKDHEEAKESGPSGYRSLSQNALFKIQIFCDSRVRVREIHRK